MSLAFPGQGSDRLLRASGLAFAIALHVAALLAVTRLPADHAGAGGADLDAISVEVTLVPAFALESRSKADVAAAGAVGATDEMEGAAERDAIEAGRKAEPAAAAPAEEQALAMARTAPVKVAEPERKATEAAEDEVRDEAPQAAHESDAGGTVARADVPSAAPKQGFAAASAGEVRRYANRLAEALGRTKPRGIGIRGTVRLKFAVGLDGSLEFLSVLESSGNQRLDQAALDAVRRAALPAPPEHMTALQRTFELPYRFR